MYAHDVMDEEKVGELYLDLAVDQLSEERARKESIEQRAVIVISSSGVLVSLQFAIAAVRTRLQTFVIPKPVSPLLISSIALFIIAAALALAINVPLRRHPVVQVDHLRTLFDAGGDEKALRVALASMHKTRVNMLA
jgi:hypothetical protein